jgi:hypothetical protein
LVVGVDLMAKANPGARKSIAVIETRFEADETLAVGEQREMAATNGASDLPIEIRNSASSVAPNGSRTNHHSTGSSPVTRILASGKHLAASGGGAASYKTTRTPPLCQTRRW